MPIINSLLDTDYYIFTMAQACYHQYSNVTAKFKYKNRSVGSDRRSNEFMDALYREIMHLCSLKFKESEIQFLKNTGEFKDTFLDFLRILKLNEKHVKLIKKGVPFYNGEYELRIEIEGPLPLIIWFEVPLLAIINELHNNFTTNAQDNLRVGRYRLLEKLIYIDRMNKTNLNIVEFGTRRRNSFEWQKEMTEVLIDKDWYKGTSNVLLSKEFGLKPVGTMAHLWFQLHQQTGFSLELSQRVALQAWIKEYRGKLGIALSDIGGMDWFLKDFDSYFARVYDGCRHDSNDPFIWGEKLIRHYKKLGINPRTKTAVFSDELTFPKVINLHNRFNGRIGTSFGIGTYLTNDVYVKPQQIVIKMVECNGKPVAKLSDSEGKGMCEDPYFEKHFKEVIRRVVNG